MKLPISGPDWARYAEGRCIQSWTASLATHPIASVSTLQDVDNAIRSALGYLDHLTEGNIKG